MAQEPNNQMDDLLKGYAKQRRQQAGEPFAMHPATRRMLRDEVARTLGRQAAPSRWDMLRLWWPRLALGGASAAIVAVAAVVVMQQAAKKPGPQQQDAYALMTPAAAPAKAEQQFNEMTAAQQQVAAAQAVPAAEAERVAGVAGATRQEIKELDEVKVVAASPPAAKPMPTLAAAPTALPPAASAPASYGRQFRTIPAGVENMARASQRMRFAQATSTRGIGAKDQSQAEQQVLASFQFEQSGDRIVIVDADGSTYEGQAQFMQADPVEQGVDSRRQTVLAKTAEAPAPAAAPAEAVRGAAGLERRDGLAEFGAAERPRLQQQLLFSAAGTNRSLRQRVIISGTLDLDAHAPASNVAVAGRPLMLGVAVAVTSNAPAPAAAAPAEPALLPQSRARMQGTFRVGDAPAVRLDAVGVEP